MKNTNKGFTVVEALLAVIIVLLLGYIIFSAWTATKNNDQSTENSNSSQQTATQNNSYAGWKEQCATSTGYCLKYPPTWKPDLEAGAETVMIRSDTDNVAVFYSSDVIIGGKNGQIEPATVYFTVLSVKDIAGLKGAKSIAGVLEDRTSNPVQFMPKWYVMSQDSIDKYGLKLNERSDVGYFTPWLNTTTQVLHVSSGDRFTSIDEAKKWFEKPQVKQAGLVLESLRIK